MSLLKDIQIFVAAKRSLRRRRLMEFLAYGLILAPAFTALASKQSADNRASYAFGGVTNTAAQGYPVPLLYGRRRIGGAIISAGIYVEDQQ